MTLGRTSAYCFTCLAPKGFAMNYSDALAANGMTVRTGTCVECASRMVRILPGMAIPEQSQEATDTVYATADPQTYVPGRYTNVPTYGGGQRETWVEGTYVDRIGSESGPAVGYKRVVNMREVLSNVVGSVDVWGQRADGMVPWEDMLAVKAGAGHFDAIVAAVASEGMRCRVVMWDRYGDGGWHVGNGHHRLVASLLLGLEWLPIFRAVDSDYMRCQDSEDEESPISRRTGSRSLWEHMRDALPTVGGNGGGNGGNCARCELGCMRTGCCGKRHDTGCANAPAVVPATGTATRNRKRARMDARNAAGGAVYGLLVDARKAGREARERAAELRAQAEALDAEAAAYEVKAAALWPLYDAAANIGATA